MLRFSQQHVPLATARDASGPLLEHGELAVPFVRSVLELTHCYLGP